MRRRNGPKKGLIILFSGDGGTSFFTFPNGGSSGVAGTSYAGDYHGAGYTIAQVEWRSDWNDNTSEPTVKSLKDEACRPDTLMRWLNGHVSQGGYTCAQGHSGGGGEIAYAMEFYGADRNSSGGYLNEALFTSGPAESDLKAGGQYPQPAGGPPISVCAGGKCLRRGVLSSAGDSGTNRPSHNSCSLRWQRTFPGGGPMGGLGAVSMGECGNTKQQRSVLV